MSTAAALKAGSIVVVRFPFLEVKGYKWRPGLVVTGDVFHKQHGLCWVMMITTDTQAKRHDIAIAPSEETGLLQPCFIRPSKMVATDLRTIRWMGQAPNAVTREAVAFARDALAG